MTDTRHDSEERQTETIDVWVAGTEEPPPPFDPTDEGRQEIGPDESEARLAEQLGRVVSDDYLYEETEVEDERMIVNMGPQHPSTHGVLRLQIELEGEVIRRTRPIIGYLHTGMEKTAETLTFLQGPTNVTRMDYLAPLHNELAYSLAVEKLLDVEVPPRAQAIRVLMTELNRMSSHLVALATNGMDIGALSMMLYGFRERELILAFFERVTGLRMNHNYIRPGGVAADLPPGWRAEVLEICDTIPERLAGYSDLLDNNPIWLERTRGVGVVTGDECNAYSITGPTLRAAGVPWDIRKAFPYSGIEQYEFDIAVGEHGDVYDRYRVRMDEIAESIRIVRQVVETMPKGDYRVDDRKITPPPRARIDESMEALIHHFKIFTEGFKVPPGETYVAVESPRGELACYIVSNGEGKPWKMHTRAPSFYNLQSLPIMMADSLVADTVASIASLDPVMGDVDR
jgi:NADH-quinone oxidoreductase subunit D